MAEGSELQRRLKSARKRSGLTQEQVAHKVSVSVITISRYERGAIKAPDLEVISKLADLYETTIGWLLGKDEPSSEEATPNEPPNVVNEVIEELGARISPKVQQVLRTTNWHQSGLSAGTVRSYAMDLMLGGLGSEPVAVKRRSGRVSLDDD